MSKLSPLTKYRLRIVLFITVIWVLLGIVIEIYNSLSYDRASDSYIAYFPFGDNMLQHLLITSVGPLLGGLFGGSLIIFVFREKLRRRSFGFKLFVQATGFAVIICFLIMIVGAIQAMLLPDDFSQSFIRVVFTWRVLRLLITWFTVVFFTLLILDVNEKYGQGVLWRMITGKYHNPVTEERIFMFLDLNDSTGLAEKLGNKEYFRMLRGIFFIATEPVMNSEGEISNYVGDEIILSWTVKKGLHNANCLQCYYRINKEMDKYREEFLRLFGTVPVFKAAVHMGSVVIGEIGVIKRDIVFAGDVLNSTSRILSLSKDYGEQLLVSDVIYEKLKDDRKFTFQFLDALVLRGRSTESRIYAVRTGNS